MVCGGLRRAFLLMALCAGAASAQQGRPGYKPPQTPVRTPSAQNTATAQLLTSEEGLAVLGAALESRHHKAASGDCSHLVNAIYAQAGFSYSYASSSELYAGVRQFQRVTSPQPGDVVVWPGHTGIMINPGQHSFFSALRTGHGVELYDAPYWKAKGRPRFFRYVKTMPPPVLSAATRTGNPKPATLRPAALRNEAGPAERTAAIKSPPPAPSSERPELQLQAQLASPAIPRIQVVNAALPKPEQVHAAMEQIFNSTEEALRGQDIFALRTSLVSFDQIAVTQVSVKGNQGWAEVKISGPSVLAAGKANLQKTAEQQRWPLTRRDSDQWELILPLDTVYLPRDRAARVLAHQLATLTDDSSPAAHSPEKKAELARLLNALLKR
jgi:NlpC/P60 family